MPIGNSRRMGTGIFVDPGLMPMLLKNNTFPQNCTLEASTIGHAALGDATYTWAQVPGYISIPCRKFDRLPHDDRTIDIIEELKFWTIGLGGFYPNIQDDWRVVIDQTGEIFAIDGIDTDSLELMTVITAHIFVPSAEVS